MNYNQKHEEMKAEAIESINEIYFEPSACYNLIHFEIKMDNAERKMVNKFLETL